MKCPLHQETEAIIFKEWKEILDLENLWNINNEVQKKLDKVLAEWTLFEWITWPDFFKTNNDRYSKEEFLETGIYWRLMQEIIEDIIKWLLKEINNEKWVASWNNIMNNWIINNSIIQQIIKAKTKEGKLVIILDYVYYHIYSKILCIFSFIEIEYKNWVNKPKHQLLQLIKTISKKHWDKNFWKSKFIELFMEKWIFNSVANTVIMIDKIYEQSNDGLKEETIKECFNNSKDFFIELSRSNIFAHAILETKWSVIKYNKENNCIEFNITKEELEESENIDHLKWLWYTSCPMLYWKTSFFWEKSNWILDFQKLMFEIIILLLKRSSIIK